MFVTPLTIAAPLPLWHPPHEVANAMPPKSCTDESLTVHCRSGLHLLLVLTTLCGWCNGHVAKMLFVASHSCVVLVCLSLRLCVSSILDTVCGLSGIGYVGGTGMRDPSSKVWVGGWTLKISDPCIANHSAMWM